MRDRERVKKEREVECVVETDDCIRVPNSYCQKKNNLTPTPKNMVERILEEKNASTAAAKELLSLRVNAGSASVASNSGNNNNASGSGDSGVGGSNVSCSNTDNSCSQSQSGEC